MKTAVIFTSQTRFTRKYAEWIAQALQADLFELPEARKTDLSVYDGLIYGGWISAGSVQGLSWFREILKKVPCRKAAIFCVGASPAESPSIPEFLDRNFSGEEKERISVFYFPGGFLPEALPFASRMMMKGFISLLRKKKEKTEEEKEMVQMLSSSYDLSDRKYILPLCELFQDQNGYPKE